LGGLKRKRRKQINRTGFPSIKKKKKKFVDKLSSFVSSEALIKNTINTNLCKGDEIKNDNNENKKKCDRVPQEGETTDTFLERNSRPRLSVVSLEKLQGKIPNEIANTNKASLDRSKLKPNQIESHILNTDKAPLLTDVNKNIPLEIKKSKLLNSSTDTKKFSANGAAVEVKTLNYTKKSHDSKTPIKSKSKLLENEKEANDKSKINVDKNKIAVETAKIINSNKKLVNSQIKSSDKHKHELLRDHNNLSKNISTRQKRLKSIDAKIMITKDTKKKSVPEINDSRSKKIKIDKKTDLKNSSGLEIKDFKSKIVDERPISRSMTRALIKTDETKKSGSDKSSKVILNKRSLRDNEKNNSTVSNKQEVNKTIKRKIQNNKSASENTENGLFKKKRLDEKQKIKEHDTLDCNNIDSYKTSCAQSKENEQKKSSTLQINDKDRNENIQPEKNVMESDQNYDDIDMTAAFADDVLEHDPLPPITGRPLLFRDNSPASTCSERSLSKKCQRMKKKYLTAGLFSNYYKEDEIKTTEKSSKISNKLDEPVKDLLLPPPYCEKYFRQTVIDFQLPFDIWWAHENSKLPGRNVVPSWNYKKIRTNVYAEVRPNMCMDHQSCCCNPNSGCTDDCLNRLVYTECSPEACPCADKCQNQKIQRHEYSPGLERFMTENKGWGIKTKSSIKKGTFILEYVGEVVTDREFKDRMASLYERDTHHYCLHLDGGLVIDGHRMGSDGRFVNHSCNPNCEMQKWSVNGLSRMALFALRDIHPDEELTYDYNFSLFNPTEGQPCRCDAINCRGVIGGKSQRVKPIEAKVNQKYIFF